MNEKSSQRILAVLIGIGLLFVVLLPLAVGRRGGDDDAPFPKSCPKPLRDYVPGRGHRLEKLPAALELV